MNRHLFVYAATFGESVRYGRASWEERRREEEIEKAKKVRSVVPSFRWELQRVG